MLGLALVCAPTAATVGGRAMGTETVKGAAATADGLPFTALTDVACAEGYTAVSSGNTLYLFNGESGGFWQEYTHSQSIAQMAFDGRGNLYFRDAHRNLYLLNGGEWTEALSAVDTQVDCGGFFLRGDLLYYANFADLNTYLYPYSADESAAPLCFNGLYSQFAFGGDTLYALNGENGLYSLNLNTRQVSAVTNFSTPRNGLTVYGNYIFSTGEGNLYRYDITENSESTVDTGDYTSLSASGETLYAVKNGEAYTYSTASETLPMRATAEFTKPHVAHIPTDSLKAQVEEGDGGFTLVKTRPNALLAEVDFEGAGETLPLLQTVRQPSVTALKIAETADYALLVYRESVAKEYQSFVLTKGNYQTLSGQAPTYEKERVGYTTNAVALHKFPHLGLSTLTDIPRNGEITLLGEVTGLDCDYYKVAYQNEIGYLPKVYVNPMEMSNAQPAEKAVGNESAGKDGVWRLAYILLGGAAIGLLVDFLILRKKKED